MKLSASSLNTLTKCGYKYELEKIKGIKEPGKKGFNMLLGDIIGDSIQNSAMLLNVHKTISDETIALMLWAAFENRFQDNGIPESILPSIKQLILNGESPDVMAEIDSLSICINMSNYEFKPPAPLKSGKVSTNKKNPPLCMKVVNALETVLWFFEEKHPWYAMIRDAKTVGCEVSFNHWLESESIYITGRYDLILDEQEETPNIFELKYVNTAYTQALVDVQNQVITYKLAGGAKSTVYVVDLTEKRVYKANPNPLVVNMVKKRYWMADQIVKTSIFMPACGTNPYDTKRMLCGFKGTSDCEYGCGGAEDNGDE